MLVLAHSTVGLQHASMGIYNAWAGRAPIYIMLGNTLDAAQRRPGVEWYHSAQDAAAMVRDFTKWDDTPISLPHFAESAVRAYKIAMTLPMEPVVLVLDSDLQEAPVANEATLRIPKLTLDAHPQGDSGGNRRDGPPSRRGGESRGCGRTRRAHTGGHAAPHRIRGGAPGAGHRPGRQPALAPSPQSGGWRGSIAQRRCDPGPRSGELLGRGALLPRSAGAQLPVQYQERREADQHGRQ